MQRLGWTVSDRPDDAFRATVRRSVDLLAAFRQEQTRPDVFYSALARDSAAQVASYLPLEGARLLDVGGGPGYFAEAFEARGALYVPLDADAGELALHGRAPGPRTVLGDGTSLPFRDAGFDVVYSSNVAEHVRHPWRMADEMVRVVRPGGLVFLSYTLWYGPWGGHETAPWHYLGGDRAARRYTRRHGRPPKNVYGQSLFRTTAAAGLRWARARQLDGTLAEVHAVPRYLPRWAYGLARVPVLREVICWNLAVVGRRSG
ncbi:MAG: methyltransferase domain-containing protein [Frankiales bacterium]|nr:methyltransferase domain-containing protein [Frankiales bacterium]